jgi:hypothetical protein
MTKTIIVQLALEGGARAIDTLAMARQQTSLIIKINTQKV